MLLSLAADSKAPNELRTGYCICISEQAQETRSALGRHARREGASLRHAPTLKGAVSRNFCPLPVTSLLTLSSIAIEGE